MAGLIRRVDIDEVRTRVNIADIIGEHVTLRKAGPGSLKGLCPFHDEKSPSFHVRTQNGRYHCFGCGESGDVFTFIQNMEHVSFSEAVERLAHSVGVTLQYEGGGQAGREQGSRSRILQANRAAAEFYQQQLSTAEAESARLFLTERGFDQAAAEQYGLGFSPRSYSALSDALKKDGFTPEELLAAGLTGQGDRGPYDRFRGRLMWPIRDVTGQTIGFGARKLFEDDNGPKYLNTPETLVYHKAKTLYGLDLARKDISRNRTAVIVEGYTDVMACHLAGITTAVATCGTAFGLEHISVLRRMMGDDQIGIGEIVFLFDPDQAGEKAALRAFAEEKRFSAQTYVAVPESGYDPCDLRVQKGDAAVRALIDNKEPMFEFVMKQILGAHDLDAVAGRVAALRETAPIIAEIRDAALKPGYVRYLAGALGMDLDEVQAAVNASGSTPDPYSLKRKSLTPSKNLYQTPIPISSPNQVSTKSMLNPNSAPPPEEIIEGEIIDHRDGVHTQTSLTESQVLPSLAQIPMTPDTRLEVEALAILLQYPKQLQLERMAEVVRSDYSHQMLATVRDTILENIDHFQAGDWVDTLATKNPNAALLIQELAVLPLPQAAETRVNDYINGVTAALLQRQIEGELHDLFARLKRASAAGDTEQSMILQQELQRLEKVRRELKEERG